MSESSGTPRTKSLERAVVLLRAVAEEPGGRSASALARATGLPRSTVTRTLRTLADRGFAAESAGGWRLGDELVRMARAADPHRAIVEAARAPLARLRDDVEESALLAVPRGRTGMEILLQLDPERHIGVTRWVGAGVALHASAAGKLILAELGEAELDEWLRTERPLAFTERTIVDRKALRARARPCPAAAVGGARRRARGRARVHLRPRPRRRGVARGRRRLERADVPAREGAATGARPSRAGGSGRDRARSESHARRPLTHARPVP